MYQIFESLFYLDLFQISIYDKNETITFDLLNQKSNWEKLFEFLSIPLYSYIINLRLMWFCFGKIDIAIP